MRRSFACVGVSLGLVACAGHPPPRVAPSPATSGLVLIGEFIFPPQAVDALKEARFGGISGLATDLSTGDLLGVCDDSDKSRVFVFRTRGVESGEFGVDLRAYLPLPAVRDRPLLDPEAIAVTLGGRIFVASEGLGNRDPRVPPAIVEYNRRADYIGALPIPDKFMPPVTGPITRGVRANAAFESLTLTPDQRHMFTATETALAQDGEPANFEHGTMSRILEYEISGGSFLPRREFAYPVEALPKSASTKGFFINGLVELLALSDTEMLAMERGYAEPPDGGRAMNRIRIFRISIAAATDISAMDSIRGRSGIAPVRKTLLLDLADERRLSAELANLDNFEGMAFGPLLPDNSRSLLIVSDDNFSPRQRTAFLAFRIVETRD
jgi:hypothetical protein